MDKSKNLICNIYVVLIFGLLGIYYEYSYSNIIEAKSNCALFLSIMITVFYVFLANKKDIRNHLLRKSNNYLLIILLSLSLTLFFSHYKIQSLNGFSGWRVGTIQILLQLSVYFILSSGFRLYKYTVPLCMVFSIIILFIAVLNSFDIDVLSMHHGMSETGKYNYISTIGNSNTFSGYLSMIYSFCLGIFLFCKRKITFFLSVASLVLGNICIFVCNCDSFWVSCFFVSFPILIYVIKQRNIIAKVIIAALLFCFTSIVLYSFRYILYEDRMERLTGITALFFNIKLSIILTLILTVLFVIKLKTSLFDKISNRNAFIALFSIYAVIIAAVVCYSIIKFDNSWGTYRGFIWRKTCEMFKNLSLSEKIFGIGTDCFGIRFNELYGTEIMKIFGVPVLNAHNEFLQYLITNGIFGLIIYICIYIRCLFNFFTVVDMTTATRTAYLPVCSYIGQAFFNNPNMFNYAILCVFVSYVRLPPNKPNS